MWRSPVGSPPARISLVRFGAQYGVAPTKFDLASFRRSRREALEQTHHLKQLPINQKRDVFAAIVRKLPARRVAYIRVHRPYEGEHVREAFARLEDWAEARGLADGQWLGYQWEDPEIVPLEKCRYDVGLEVPNTTSADGEVSITTLPPFEVAEIEIAGSVELELRALDWLFRTWLPSSGYAPAHQPMFEAFKGRPFAHGMEHFELRIQLPVVNANVPL